MFRLLRVNVQTMFDNDFVGILYITKFLLCDVDHFFELGPQTDVSK